MFTVGIKVGLGGGSWGYLPTPAVTGNCATSPQAVSAIATATNSNERLRNIIIEPDSRLVLRARHLPATQGAFSTYLDAFIHSADFLAIDCTCLANFGANPANKTMEVRATELEIGRCLADLGAVHHQTEMFCFNVFSASLKTMIHGGLQADLMAMATSLYTGLHGLFSVGVG